MPRVPRVPPANTAPSARGRAKGKQWSASLAQRQCRWPAKHRKREKPADEAGIGTDVLADLARIERILPSQLTISESLMHGYGIHARKPFAPGNDIAFENALVWAALGKKAVKGTKSFNALELFPHDTLDAEAQQSAVTLTLALLQRTAKTVELLQSWFRLCYKGPQNWRTLPTTKLALERRLRFAREILAKNSVNLQITDEEFMALDLQRIGTGWARRLVAALRLYELTSDTLRLMRVGPRSDGYVMLDTGESIKQLLSYGVGTNIDFEWDLAILGAKVHLFDHTVACLPRQHPNFSFYQEALCAEELPGVGTTLTEGVQLLGAGPSVLKCDVEGAEFASILSTDSEVLGRLDQLCLELHWLGRPRCGDAQVKAMALEKLNEQFVMLHAHGNSYGDVVDVAGYQIPDVLEVLYVHRRLLGSSFRPSGAGLVPSELDANNCPFVPDICLRGAPFGADVPDEAEVPEAKSAERVPN
ncbi:unnamed protein product, partial [Effrenium voratum]